MVQVSGGAPGAQNAASPRQSRANLRIGDNRVDTIFERGHGPALFLPGAAELPMNVASHPILDNAMTRSKGSELARGSTLALTIEAILDFAGAASSGIRSAICST